MSNLEKFKAKLPFLCEKDTAAGGGKGWEPDNPLWGHCAVVSLWVQNFFGGSLSRVSLEDTEFSEYRSHYLNILPDGREKDLTLEQFKGKLPTDIPHVKKGREYVINGADTRVRYARFGWRLLRALYHDWPLMHDSKYLMCIEQALLSPCQKMGFGAILAGHVTGTPFANRHTRDHNRSIPGLENMCTPRCIRFDIPSRTESMLGQCGHAEEWVLVEHMSRTGHNESRSTCDLYVAGVESNGRPLIKQEAEFTCLRCAVLIHHASRLSGLGRVWVPVVDHWEPLSPYQCLETAQKYALKEKSV